MSEGAAFNIEDPNGQSAKEILKREIDEALDDYFLLLSRRGLDKHSRNQLEEDIKHKRQLLIQLTQQLNARSELDDAFSGQIETQLGLAEKGIETGREKLRARPDGLDNVEAIIADMKIYSDELNKVDLALGRVGETLKSRSAEKEEKEEIENLIIELKIMINAFMKIGGEIQRLILSLKVDDKAELVRRQLKMVNDAVQAIKNFDETSKDKNELNKIKEHFYEHFDEILLFYEELRDLKNNNF
ncbi:MAG: hypothetical protein WC465_01595 [Patescibacteria group bacterium]